VSPLPTSAIRELQYSICTQQMPPMATERERERERTNEQWKKTKQHTHAHTTMGYTGVRTEEIRERQKRRNRRAKARQASNASLQKRETATETLHAYHCGRFWRRGG
jgi:hypothetical protein